MIKIKTQNGTKLKKIQNLKTQIVPKLEIWQNKKCNKTKKKCDKTKNSKCDTNQKLNCDETQKL